MATCFVIQPFDSGKFDKRFEDIYRPAIEAAGLEAYRVDKDPGGSVPIESIENGIKQAAICLADITADNPNVWYELGFAFASGRPIVMVCSEERTGKKYPFDIQHRSIIPYLADAPSDFDRLRENLTEKLKALIEKGEVLRSIAESAPVATVEGLSHIEIIALAVIAGNSFLPNTGIFVYTAKQDAERAGVTNMGFNLAVRRLMLKKFIALENLIDEQTGEHENCFCVTETGWSWIEKNESHFVLHRTAPKKPSEDIPF